MSFFMAKEYSIVCLYVYKTHTQFLFIHHRPLGCFHMLAISHDAINLDVCLHQLVLLISSYKYPEADMLDNMSNSIFNF